MILFKKAIVLIVILLITHTALAFNSLNEGLPGSYRSMNFEVYAPDKDKSKKRFVSSLRSITKNYSSA